MNKIKPYEHKVTVDDIWNYRPEDESTHTSMPILNAVAEALHSGSAIYAAHRRHYSRRQDRVA